jgi:hypothetical protein
MKAIARITLLPLAAVALAAQAQVFIPKIFTHNKYNDKAVWITVYDLGKLRHLDYGCMKAGSERTWTSGGYAFGSYYYVRGEVKEKADCGGRTLCDTTVQIHPMNMGIISSGKEGRGPEHVNWYIHPNGNNCYWDENF